MMELSLNLVKIFCPAYIFSAIIFAKLKIEPVFLKPGFVTPTKIGDFFKLRV